MIFKEIHFENGKKKFLMGGSIDSLKEVTEDTYRKLSEDEYVNRISFSTPSTSRGIDINEIYLDDDADILKIIRYLNSIKPEEAVEVFRGIIIDVIEMSFSQGCIDAYDTIGKFAHKTAARIETQLECNDDDDI